MPEIAVVVNNGPVVIETVDNLGGWLARARPRGAHVALDTEGSGLHVDGNWATDAAKCEPEARVSVVSLAWRDEGTDDLVSVAIPFDQGFIGGKKGRYIKKATNKNPVTGWETLPHTDGCRLAGAGVVKPFKHCSCAPWNFGVWGWVDLTNWLAAEVYYVTFFNAKFDLFIMQAGLRDGAHDSCHPNCLGWQHAETCPNAGIDISEKFIHDVMVFEAIRVPDEKISLDATAKRYFNETKDTGMAEGLKANGVGLTKRYDLVNWATTAKYAAKDADLTYRAEEHQMAMVDAGEIDDKDFPIIKREMRKALVLFDMERRGVGFDAKLCAEQAVTMHAEVDKLVKDLPFPDTNVAAAKYFFNTPEDGGLGVVPIKLTEGGQPSCDAQVVAQLAGRKDNVGEVAKLWQHIANMKSVCSKWYDAWPHRAGADNRLRTTFWQFATEDTNRAGNAGGAISGRLSASRVQLQGVPQAWRIPEGVVGIKKLFRAKPGHQVWSFDASNAEVRVTAWLTQCQALANVINSGVNIHSANTVNIMGEYLAATWEQHFGQEWPHGKRYDIIAQDETGEMLLDDDGDPVYIMSKHPEWKKVRTAMKRGIFGTIYASGVRTLKSQIDNDLKDDIPERQIRGFMDALNAAYPEIKRTSKQCERMVDVTQGGRGFVRLVSGRRRVFGWGEVTYKALNACVQGGVAEAMSILMLEVDDAYPGMLINQVHDDLWLEVPDAMVEEVRTFVRAKGKEIFEGLFQTPKLKVDFKFDSKRVC